MKLVVLAIDALSLEILQKNRIPAFDKFQINEMKSTIPCITPPAWSTIWSGKNPSEHGIIGTQSFIAMSKHGSKADTLYMVDMPEYKSCRIWDYLATKGLRNLVIDVPLSLPVFEHSLAEVESICHQDGDESFFRGWDLRSYEDMVKDSYCIENVEGEDMSEGVYRSLLYKRDAYTNLKDIEDIDILYLGFNCLDVIMHYYGTDGEKIQKALDYLNDVIGHFAKDNKVIVLSDHGFETTNFAFNIDTFLANREYLKFNKDGSVDFKNSLAYPANIGTNLKVIQDFGIYINTSDKEFGMVDQDQYNNLVSQIIMSIQDTYPDVSAIHKSQYYKTDGEFYKIVPDVVLSSVNMQTCFETRYNKLPEYESYGYAVHSERAVFAINFQSKFGRNLSSVEEVYNFICKEMDVEVKYLQDKTLIFPYDYYSESAEKKLKALGYIE